MLVILLSFCHQKGGDIIEKKFFVGALEIFFVFAGVALWTELFLGPIYHVLLESFQGNIGNVEEDVTQFKKVFFITFMFMFLLYKMWNLFRED